MAKNKMSATNTALLSQGRLTASAHASPRGGKWKATNQKGMTRTKRPARRMQPESVRNDQTLVGMARSGKKWVRV